MIATLFYLFLTASAAQPQESKPVPKDSVQIDAPGCLKGRVFTGMPRPEAENVVRGPDVVGRHFRIAGPREVMDLVKKYDGHLVQVVGIVRRAALDDAGVEMRGGRGGRVAVGGSPGLDPSRMDTRTTPSSAATMDVSSVRMLSDRCPVQ